MCDWKILWINLHIAFCLVRTLRKDQLIRCVLTAQHMSANTLDWQPEAAIWAEILYREIET